MTVNKEIRIPKVFLDDHRDRDLPTPNVVRETRSHYFISATDPALDELRNDAAHYANPKATDADLWLKRAAKALLTALNR